MSRRRGGIRGVRSGSPTSQAGGASECENFPRSGGGGDFPRSGNYPLGLWGDNMIVNPLTAAKYFGGVYRFTRATIFPPGWGGWGKVGMRAEWMRRTGRGERARRKNKKSKKKEACWHGYCYARARARVVLIGGGESWRMMSGWFRKSIAKRLRRGVDIRS